MRCYVAGPMRGQPAFNFPAFFDAERRLVAAGWHVFNPARMDVLAGTATADGVLLHEDGPMLTRECAARDLDVLVSELMAETGDAVVLLPGHEASKGATAEAAVARWLGLRVLTLEEATNR